jgi:Kef-type K+ transport system membrane component KefB
VVETQFNHPLIILLVGCIIVLAILVRSSFTRGGLPPLVGFMVFGFLLNLADFHYTFLSPWAREIFKLLAELGIITLLFRVGLESNIFKLLRQLRRASYIWISGVGLSGALGYGIAYYLVGLALIPSLFIAIALTATSVGVSAGIWQEAGAINSPTGELLIDVAELDDISAIIFMALLFAVAPVLETGDGMVFPLLGRTTVLLVVKLLAFGAGCYLFAQFLEQRLTKFFQRIGSPPAPMLLVAGIGFVIAALADLMGFSVALGAFFAGLVFSRDPASVTIDASFGSLFELFSPFFFISIGLNINPDLLVGALGLGLVLLLGAILGKVVGHGVPTWFALGGSGAVLLGFSMVPRAEIALIIMEQGVELGPWAVPPEAYAAMVMVSAVTCLFPPLMVKSLLRRWPQPQEESPA